MEIERLVPKRNSDIKSGFTSTRCGAFSRELNRVNWIALPMIVVTVSQFLLRVSPMFMLGHLDQLSLSSASIATSRCNVTGFSLVKYTKPELASCLSSTLISNELGAGNPEAARVTLYSVLLVSTAEFLIASIAVVICGHILGYAFSGKKEVVDYVKKMAPLLGLSIIMDSLQVVLSGVARGSGWQHIGAYVNLGAYYLVGTPVALLMAFVLHLKGQGLWRGMVAGAMVQCIALSVITGLANWEKQAKEARRRIFSGEFPAQSESICEHGQLVETC